MIAKTEEFYAYVRKSLFYNLNLKHYIVFSSGKEKEKVLKNGKKLDQKYLDLKNRYGCDLYRCTKTAIKALEENNEDYMFTVKLGVLAAIKIKDTNDYVKLQRHFNKISN